MDANFNYKERAKEIQRLRDQQGIKDALPSVEEDLKYQTDIVKKHMQQSHAHSKKMALELGLDPRDIIMSINYEHDIESGKCELVTTYYLREDYEAIREKTGTLESKETIPSDGYEYDEPRSGFGGFGPHLFGYTKTRHPWMNLHVR